MAVTLPIKPTVKPSNLTGQLNGRLDLNLTVPVSGGVNGIMHRLVARGWRALASAANHATGEVLSWTPGGTYRTYTQQLNLFLSRYKPVSRAVYDATPFAHRKQWTGAILAGYSSIYWIKKDFRYATAAVPGTSNHGWAVAIDGCLAGNIAWTPILSWLAANAHRYGFAWELAAEPWHIGWIMGDAVPQAVLDYENPSEPEPEPQPQPVGDDDVAEYLIHYPAKPASDGTPPDGWTLLRMVGSEIQHVAGPLGDWLPELRKHVAAELVVPGWEAMVKLLDRSRVVGVMPDGWGGGGGDLRDAWVRAGGRVG